MAPCQILVNIILIAHSSIHNSFVLVVELSFCGVILQNENTLSSYGVVPGVTIHVVQKGAPKYQKSEKKMAESEIVNSFRTITLFNEYRSILQVSIHDDLLLQYINFLL